MRKILLGCATLLATAVLVLAVLIAIPVDPTVPYLEARPTTEYWSMDGGYRIAYTRVSAEDPGEKKPPVVFLHGGPGGFVSASAIEDLGALAELGHDVYLYDQVGSDLSDRLEKPKDYGFLGHVDDLREIVTEKIGPPVILIGQSYGGMLASYFVAHYPDVVEKAVLTSPGKIQPVRFDDEGNWINERRWPVPDSLEFRDPAADVSHEMKVRSWPPRFIATVALATTLNVKLMSDEEADAALNTVVTKIAPGMVCDAANVPDLEQGIGMGAYSHGWSNWFGGVDDWRDELRETDVPLLVLQGQCDVIPYPTAYEHAALAPRGEYRFVEDAGHKIRWERPEAYLAEIVRFLADSTAPSEVEPDPGS